MPANGFQRRAILLLARRCALIDCSLAILAVSASSARADSPVYVDDDGLCAGNAPCFTTIEAGIALATDPDDPLTGAAAEVIVYPGYYTAHIDLSAMGSAVAAAPGDIALLAADPDDRPLLFPNVHAAIYTHLPFPGHVIIDGFHVVPLGFDFANGISLDRVDGSATLRNLNAEGLPGTGIDLSAIAGTVTIEHVAADLNGTGGIHVESSGDIHIYDCTASATLDGTGIFAETDGGSISVTNVIADNNSFRGMDLVSNGFYSGPISINTTTAGANGGCGIKVDADASVAITTANANNNNALAAEESFNAAGIKVTALFHDVELRHVNVSGNIDGEGIQIGIAEGVTMSHITALNNGSSGVFLFSVDHASLERITANENERNGIHASADSITITDSNTNENERDGIHARADSLTITDSNTNGNETDGIGIYHGGDVTINTVNANRNNRSGIATAVDGDVTVHDVVTNENWFFGVELDAGGYVEIRRSTANDSTFFGGFVVYNASRGVSIIDASAHRNGRYSPFNSTTRGAGGYGFILYNNGPIYLGRATAVNNILMGLRIYGSGSDVTLDALYVADNMFDGVLLVGPLGPACRINGSMICGNGDAGLRLDGDIDVNAEGNWWGDSNGPTHAGNPGGAGDSIVDSASGGGFGLTDFAPWIDTIVDAIAHDPPIVGQPTEVSFVLSDAAHTVFLGEGPGASTGPAPFRISTTNGLLTTETQTDMTVDAFINHPDGLLTVTWTPAAPGSAAIDFDFCGHSTHREFVVALDCNTNGLPDSDELPGNDCNENLVPDDCDIAAATSADINANGRPDECESISPADLNLDGRVDLTDFLTFAACFAGPNVATPPDGCSADDSARADIDRDGDVDLGDFASFATQFGA